MKLFASLREAAGLSEDHISALTLEELVTEAVRRYGEGFQAGLGYCKIALNGIAVEIEEAAVVPLNDDDEVAFLPPVSGG